MLAPAAVNNLRKMVCCLLCKMDAYGAKEVSANWTHTLLEENKVFPTFFPKIEKGETILLKTFARMIREMNKNHSQQYFKLTRTLLYLFQC